MQVTGPNGSGKTTLLRALCGLVPLEAGQVWWRGRDVAQDAEGFHRELNYLGHDNALKGDLTASENLRYDRCAQAPSRASPTDIAAALARTGVADSATQLLRRLSAGQRRRVALARLALTGGALWVLDEPDSHLDAAGRLMLQGLLDAHLDGGGAAVVATHQALDLSVTQLAAAHPEHCNEQRSGR